MKQYEAIKWNVNIFAKTVFEIPRRENRRWYFLTYLSNVEQCTYGSNNIVVIDYHR